jgi:uncharacterized protein YdhG (YjbR/CyaY superfamily)
MPKKITTAKTVDDYLSAIPKPSRGALEKLRATIKSVVPGAAEGISYGIVVLKHRGKGLVGLGATDNHCSFYLMSTTIIPAFKSELKGFEAKGGTIHFSVQKPLPDALVKKLVKARISENERAAKRK